MVYGVASMLGVPDMSGRNLKSLQGTNGHAPRRALSTYDKMQEARARRAALFGEGDPANLPRPAQPCEPDVTPEPAHPWQLEHLQGQVMPGDYRVGLHQSMDMQLEGDGS